MSRDEVLNALVDIQSIYEHGGTSFEDRARSMAARARETEVALRREPGDAPRLQTFEAIAEMLTDKCGGCRRRLILHNQPKGGEAWIYHVEPESGAQGACQLNPTERTILRLARSPAPQEANGGQRLRDAPRLRARLVDAEALLRVARIWVGISPATTDGQKLIAAWCDDYTRWLLGAALAESPAPEAFYVIFDGPPSHESGRFVEVETADGRSVSVGGWEQHGEYWRLGPFVVA